MELWNIAQTIACHYCNRMSDVDPKCLEPLEPLLCGIPELWLCDQELIFGWTHDVNTNNGTAHL